MDYRYILWEPHESEKIVTVTLNRPDKHNIMNLTMRRELDDAIDRAERSPDINVLVLKGSGRSFCAGYDMDPDEEEKLDPDAKKPGLEGWRDYLQRMSVDKLWKLWNAEVATVCSVQDNALAGGLELASACDIVIAAEDARLGEPEIRHASAPPTLFLPWTIPTRHARYLLLTGDTINGKEAERMSLVNRAVPADQLDAEVELISTKLSRIPAPAIKYNKLAINHAQETAGMYSSFLYNVGTTAELHSTPEGARWVDLIDEVGFAEFLRQREAPFKDIKS